VDQCLCLERLTGLRSGQLPGRLLAKLVRDQRQELLGRLRVVLFDCEENLCDVIYGC
jgi:hypothetical protein